MFKSKEIDMPNWSEEELNDHAAWLDEQVILEQVGYLPPDIEVQESYMEKM